MFLVHKYAHKNVYLIHKNVYLVHKNVYLVHKTCVPRTHGMCTHVLCTRYTCFVYEVHILVSELTFEDANLKFLIKFEESSIRSFPQILGME